MQKNNIMEKYENATNLFAVIVADLTLETPDKKSESYRFVYNDQQIPSDVFTPSTLERGKLFLILLILVALILLLFVLACLCTKVFVPMIARLKNRMLVEENGGDKSGGDKEVEPQAMEPPPSSDRQNMNALSGPETE